MLLDVAIDCATEKPNVQDSHAMLNFSMLL